MGGKSDQSAATSAAQSQANVGQSLVNFSKQMWGEQAPYRKQTESLWSNVMKGGPQLQQAVAPQINSATQQFATAKKSATELAPGGLRDVTARNLNIAEAGAKTGIYSGGVNQAATQLASQAAGGTQQGISAMSGASQAYGGAAGAYTNLAQMGMQQTSGLAGGLGSLVAMI